MIAEYAAYYGPPDREMPLPLFQLLLSRIPMIDARARLGVMTGTAWAIGRVFGDHGSELDRGLREVEEIAYPSKTHASNSEDEAFALMQRDPEPSTGKSDG